MLPSRQLLYSFGTLLCLAALMAACGGASPPGETPSPADAGQTEIQAEPAAPTAQPPTTDFTSPLPHEQSPLPTPTDMTEAGPVKVVPPGKDPGPGSAPLTGEVPQDLLDAVFDDLAERLDAGREAIAVEQAGAVIWRDGSLGCPQPDMMYTQALVPGYRIILSVGDESFDYHTSERGYFVLCEGGLAEKGLPSGEAEPGLEQVVGQAKEDLALRLSVVPEQITVLEAKAVVWPDSSLGCPQPGMAYADVLTPGYLILLEASNKEYEYHASKGTEVIYCANPTPPVQGTPDDV